MKKFLKSIALLLTAALVVGTANIPASAAATVKVKNPTKAIYVGGCTGTKASGTKAKNKSYFKVTSLLTGYDSSKMLVKLSTSDKSIASVSNKSLKVTAKGIGTAEITVKVYSGKKAKAANLITSSTFDVTVKKNATEDTITYTGITNGATYKVGDKITVNVPKATKEKKDNDYRRLISNTPDIASVEGSGSKYTVTFKKAGSFELEAQAYMSSTYKGTTAKKTIKGTVAETVAPAKLEAKQTSLTTIVLSGLTSEVKKENIKMYTMPDGLTGTKDETINDFYTVKYDKESGTATLTFGYYGNLTAGTVYYIDVADTTVSFTAAEGALKNVARFELKTQTVSINEDTTLKFRYYNAQGVDITEAVEKDLNNEPSLLTMSLKSCDDKNSVYFPDQAYANTPIVIMQAGIRAQIHAVLPISRDSNYNPVTVEADGVVIGRAKTYANSVIYTITDGEGAYLTEKDTKLSHELKVGDTCYLEALFLYSDEKYYKLSDLSCDISTSSDALFVSSSKSSSGGLLIYASEAGNYQVKVTNKDDSLVASLSITVKPARKVSDFTAEFENGKKNLNTGYLADQIVIKAVAKDQYGDVISEGVYFTIRQTDKTISSTGTVDPSVLSFTAGECAIEGKDVSLTGTDSYITFEISCEGIEKTKTLTAMVKEVTETNDKLWVPANTSTSVDGATTISTTLKNGKQDNKRTEVTALFSKNGFVVSESVGKLLTTAVSVPRTNLKATDLNLSEGDIGLYFTITHDGSVIDPNSSKYNKHIEELETDQNNPFVAFTPFATGSKLPAGKYTINIYKIVAGSSYSTSTLLRTQTITVVDGNPDTEVELIKNEFSGTISENDPSALAQCFNLYVDGVLVTNFKKVEFVPGNNGQYSIRSITVSGLNSSGAYGPFELEIKIRRTVKQK